MTSSQPVASFSFGPKNSTARYSPFTPVLDEEVTFDGSASTPSSQGSAIQNYLWTFEGAGAPVSTALPTLSRSFTGDLLPDGVNSKTVNVILAVTDDKGKTGSTTQQIVVKRPPVLLVHGLQLKGGFDPWKDWATMVDGLTKHGLSVYVSSYTYNTSQPTKDDIRHYAKNLGLEVNAVETQERVDKIDIVAHSMGGLVARSYIEGSDFPQDTYSIPYKYDVRKLVMLGTPNKGQYLSEIAGVFPDSIRPMISAALTASWSGAYTDLQNWTSVQQMEPSSAFLSDLNHGVSGADKGVEYSFIAGNYYQYAQRAHYFLGITLSFVAHGLQGLIDNIDLVTGWAICDLASNDNDDTVDVNSVRQGATNSSNYHLLPLKHDQLITDSTSIDLVAKTLEESAPYIIPDLTYYTLASPGELRVHDSAGRMTGVLGGVAKDDIPNSKYDSINDSVIVYPSTDNYSVDVVGTATGAYGLTGGFSSKGVSTTINAVNIPTTSGALQRYSVDWTALSQGLEGVTVQVDTNGDGIFEKTFTCGATLSADEFNLKTQTSVNFNPKTLNSTSSGNVTTSYIQLPTGYDPAKIDVSTIKVNGQVPALLSPTAIGDYNNDGIPDLMVKFDRAAVQKMFRAGPYQGDEVAATRGSPDAREGGAQIPPPPILNEL